MVPASSLTKLAQKTEVYLLSGAHLQAKQNSALVSAWQWKPDAIHTQCISNYICLIPLRNQCHDILTEQGDFIKPGFMVQQHIRSITLRTGSQNYSTTITGILESEVSVSCMVEQKVLIKGLISNQQRGSHQLQCIFHHTFHNPTNCATQF